MGPLNNLKLGALLRLNNKFVFYGQQILFCNFQGFFIVHVIFTKHKGSFNDTLKIKLCSTKNVLPDFCGSLDHWNKQIRTFLAKNFLMVHPYQTYRLNVSVPKDSFLPQIFCTWFLWEVGSLTWAKTDVFGEDCYFSCFLRPCFNLAPNT